MTPQEYKNYLRQIREDLDRPAIGVQKLPIYRHTALLCNIVDFLTKQSVRQLSRVSPCSEGAVAEIQDQLTGQSYFIVLKTKKPMTVESLLKQGGL